MERGIGTTHIALTLANYVCSKLGMKTAYIELNATNQILSISRKQQKSSFRYKGIMFYPNISVTSLSEILHLDYDVFILDMGVLNTYTIREFLRCDKPLLVCSPSKWRYTQTMERIKKTFYHLSHRHCSVILNLSQKESTTTRFISSCEHVPFPFIPNPFQLETNSFQTIYQILKF